MARNHNAIKVPNPLSKRTNNVKPQFDFRTKKTFEFRLLGNSATVLETAEAATEIEAVGIVASRLRTAGDRYSDNTIVLYRKAMLDGRWIVSDDKKPVFQSRTVS